VTFVVLYDASVLYPNTLRDLLLRIAQSGLVQARWTEQILDETFTALQRNCPDLDPHRLERTRTLMATAVRDWKVEGFEPLIDALKLPDPDDRHVLAAAIRARAQVIVTANLRHFPTDELRQWDIEPKSPDEFVRDLIGLDRASVYGAVQQIANSWRNPPGSVEDVLERLERNNLAVSVAELRAGS
jgi:predicted nucleic acid-binding protein